MFLIHSLFSFESRYNLELNPGKEIGLKLHPNNYTKTLPIGNSGS
jgi:hypothetical protein